MNNHFLSLLNNAVRRTVRASKIKSPGVKDQKSGRQRSIDRESKIKRHAMHHMVNNDNHLAGWEAR